MLAASTGGPSALFQLVSDLPADLAAPIVVAQHMLPAWLPHFVVSLGEYGSLRARTAEEDMPIEPGCIYVAPGDRHLTLARRNHRLVARLDASPPVNGCRPAADPLFVSAASVCRASVLGVVMTGLGVDGLAGARAIAMAGGTVFAQDEDSSDAWGMPGSVVKAGLAHAILPLDQLAPAIAERAGAK